jgi:hypothetical protein
MAFRLYQQMKQIDNKPKVLFATAFYVHYDVVRGYFPIEDENNEIEEILGDTGVVLLENQSTWRLW